MTLIVERVSKAFRTEAGMVPVLRDVDLVASPGETVSIIGPNGAGKSTLLRVIAGILRPTSGSVRRPAQTSSLIELGAGFHPELTGEENVALTLTLGGVGPRRRAAALGEALEFADLGDDANLPVKHLSTGAVGRLACAAAVQTRPELLVVDEVLAVGDAGFQRRMLATISEMTAEGTTLLMVTHSPELAAATTDRTVWLDHGAVVADGPVAEVLTGYEAAVRGWGRSFETSPLVIRAARLVPDHVAPGERLRIELEVEVTGDLRGVTLRVEVRPTIGDEPWMRSSEDSLEVWHLNLIAASAALDLSTLPSGRHRVDVDLRAMPISPSEVEVAVLVSDASSRIVDEVPLLLRIGSESLRPVYDLAAWCEPLSGDDGPSPVEP